MKPIRLNPFQVGTLAAVVSAVFFYSVIGTQDHSLVAWYQLAMHGKPAQGRVTSVTPELHRTCSFEYSVGAETLVGSDEGCALPVGQVVSVTYLSTEPTFATTQPVLSNFLFLLLAPIAMSLLAGIGVGVSAARRSSRS